MILWSARAESGPLAPPGNYQVRLTGDGVTQTQSFVIKKDPRLVNVTDADLAEQAMVKHLERSRALYALKNPA